MQEAILDSEFNVTLLLLARGDRVTVYPSPSERLRADDVLVMSGAIGDMERFFSSVHTGR